MPQEAKRSAKQDAIEWKNERWPIGNLVEWPRNPRILTEAQAAQLARSIQKFGFVEPIAINLDGRIIGGHQRRRIMVMKALTDPKGEVDVRVPNRQLTEDECEELAIRLNLNQGEWDIDKLANEFEVDKLLDWGFEKWQLGGIDPEDAEGLGDDEEGEALEHTCPKCGFRF
jgi:ParB-like nuclease domain